jgi:fibronectin type 3 domain-containing protein
VVLTWDCEQPQGTPANIHYQYRIYRRAVDSGADAKLADVECPDSRYEDRSIEWQKTYQYRITVVTAAKLKEGLLPCPTSQSGVMPECVQVAEIEGDDSPAQKVFTKDIYPPGVPTGLQAVFSGPRQASFVDLLWAPDTDADLAGYNVYRREEGTQPARINDGLVEASAYRDQNVVPGKTYWYSVSAVDLRGNESARSEEGSESVPHLP